MKEASDVKLEMKGKEMKAENKVRKQGKKRREVALREIITQSIWPGWKRASEA